MAIFNGYVSLPEGKFGGKRLVAGWKDVHHFTVMNVSFDNVVNHEQLSDFGFVDCVF